MSGLKKSDIKRRKKGFFALIMALVVCFQMAMPMEVLAVISDIKGPTLTSDDNIAEGQLFNMGGNINYQTAGGSDKLTITYADIGGDNIDDEKKNVFNEGSSGTYTKELRNYIGAFTSPEVTGTTEKPDKWRVMEITGNGTTTAMIKMQAVYSSYTVNFYNDAADIGDADKCIETKTYNSCNDALAAAPDLPPKKEGQIATKWIYLDNPSSDYSEDVGKELYSTRGGVKVRNVIANWENSFKVTFYIDKDNIYDTQEVTAKDPVTKPDGTPTKTGYTFDGNWYKDATSRTADDVYNFPGYVETDYNLYAGWTINKYTVTFDADGGSPTPAAQTIDYGNKAVKPDEPIKIGYDFDGWYDKDGKLFDFANTAITADTTLYAKWNIQKFVVNFYKEDTLFDTKTVEYDNTVQKPEDPEKTGMKFTGWYEEDADEPFDFNTKIKRNLDLYAGWKEDPGSNSEVKKDYPGGTNHFNTQSGFLYARLIISDNKVFLEYQKCDGVDYYQIGNIACFHAGGSNTERVETGSTFMTQIFVQDVSGNDGLKKKEFNNLKQNKYSRFRVKAYKKNGKKGKLVAKSVKLHGSPSAEKNVDYTDVLISQIGATSYNDLNNVDFKIKVGEKAKIRARSVLADPSKKNNEKRHGGIKYISSDKKVAKVTKKGKIKAKSPGKCEIYVVAVNGVSSVINVTVE